MSSIFKFIISDLNYINNLLLKVKSIRRVNINFKVLLSIIESMQMLQCTDCGKELNKISGLKYCSDCGGVLSLSVTSAIPTRGVNANRNIVEPEQIVLNNNMPGINILGNTDNL